VDPPGGGSIRRFARSVSGCSLLELARERRIAVAFDLTAPGPLWAMGRGAPVRRIWNEPNQPGWLAPQRSGAPSGTPQRAQIQRRPVGGRGTWGVLAVVSTRNRTGVLQVGVAPPGSDELRLVWARPRGGPRVESRTVEVTSS